MRSRRQPRGQIAQLRHHDEVFEAAEVRVEIRLLGHVSHALLEGDRVLAGWFAVE